MSDSTPYNMPKEPGRWRAILLATVVHAALFGLLWFGIRWQSETPTALEAEIWNPQQREAAPLPKPEPEPEVKPKPEPKPEPKPVIKEPPRPPVVEKPVEQPDIALEQEKKRIEEKKRLDEEKRKEKERQEKARLEEERQQKIAEQKAEEERIEKEKQEKLAAAKKKAEEEQLKKRLAAEKAAAEKLRQEKIEAEKLAAEKRHQENLERMTAQAGTGGTGTAPQSQGGRADSDYAGRVAAKIKSNTIFSISGGLNGNPAVEYEVQLLPDGSIRGVRLVQPSGVPGFDEAVARAIQRSAPFPPDRSGRVPSSFNVIHKPKDQ